MVNSHIERFLRDSSPLNDASWTLHLPVSMDELRAEVLEGDWGARETFDFHLRRAAAFRGEGSGCMDTDPERAFVALFRAANLLLVKVTTHPDYKIILNDNERRTLIYAGVTIFRELCELKKRIVERQNERVAATFVNHSTPIQSKIKRLPSFRANACNENRWVPESATLGLSARGYPSPPSSSVSSSPLQSWNTRPPTPNGPRAPSVAQASPRRNSMRIHPRPSRQFADTPKPTPQEGRLNLLRRCLSCAQLPRRQSESNLRHPSPLSSPKSSLRDRHPLRPNLSANVNPLKFEIKMEMNEVKAFETDLARVTTQSVNDGERHTITPKPAPRGGRLNLLRKCTSVAQIPYRQPESNLMPLSGTKSNLRQHRDRHPLRPNLSANVAPLKFEIKKEMMEVKAFKTELARVTTRSVNDRERHTNDTPKPAPQEGRVDPLRKCTSFAQLPHRQPELNLMHPSPLRSAKPPSRSPGPTPRIPLSPFMLPRASLESLRQHQDRHLLLPNISANINPLQFEIRKKMKQRRRAFNDHSASDSSAKVTAEECISSLTSDSDKSPLKVGQSNDGQQYTSFSGRWPSCAILGNNRT